MRTIKTAYTHHGVPFKILTMPALGAACAATAVDARIATLSKAVWVRMSRSSVDPPVSADKPANGGAEAPVENGYANGHSAFAGGLNAHFALREINPLREWGEQLAVFVSVGLVLGWVGPFGTFQDLAVGPRFLYWITAILLIGSASAWTMQAIARGQPSAGWPLALQVIVGALVVAVPGTFVIIALETVFRHAPPITIVTLARMYSSVTVVGLAISIPWSIIRRYRGQAARAIQSEPELAPAPTTEAAPIAAARRDSPFLERIPARLGREL